MAALWDMMAPPFDCHVAASGAATDQGALAFEQRGHGVHHRVDTEVAAVAASEVLNWRRGLNIAMIARIREKLGISADTLIGRQRAA